MSSTPGFDRRNAVKFLLEKCLIPKVVAGERPIALRPTLIRLWEALRAPEVSKKGEYRYRIGWDSTDGRNGGTERTVWEIYQAGEKIRERWPWSWIWRTLSSESVSLWAGLGLLTYNFHQKDTAGAMRMLRAPAACSV